MEPSRTSKFPLLAVTWKVLVACFPAVAVSANASWKKGSEVPLSTTDAKPITGWVEAKLTQASEKSAAVDDRRRGLPAFRGNSTLLGGTETLKGVPTTTLFLSYRVTVTCAAEVFGFMKPRFVLKVWSIPNDPLAR